MFRLIARIGTLIGAYKLIRGVLRSSGGRAAPRRPY